jgi:hypothetical protein
MKTNIEKKEDDYKKRYSTYAIYVSPDTVNQQVKKSVVELLIPFEISLEQVERILTAKHPAFAEQPGWIKKCQQFLVNLYFKEITEVYDGGFVPLMSSILKSKYGDKKKREPFYYKTIIDVLKDCKLILVNRFYEKGSTEKKGTSMGYKLILKYPEKMVRLYASEYSFQLKRTNLDFHEQLKRLTLDEYDFFSILSTVPHSEVIRGFHFYNSWVYGEFYSFNDKNGRLHSQIHNLNRVFRSSIRFNNNPLYDVDISGCQPFLLLCVVLQSLNYRKKNKLTLQQWVSKLDDLDRYVKLIQSGNLYRYLLSKYMGRKNISNNITNEDLDDFKEKFFAKVIFAHSLNRQEKLVRIFRDEFPTIYNAIDYYQKHNPSTHLANHLQQIETQVVDNVIKDLKLTPNDIALRYHDAILTNFEITESVKASLEQQLQVYVGVEGRVKVQPWGDNIEDILINKRFNPIVLGLERKKAVKKKRNKDIRKAIGKSGKSGADAAQLTIDLNRLYDHSDWRQEIEARISEIRLRYPDNYTELEVALFKDYMKVQVLKAQDTFLKYNPMLEIFRNSKTNKLHRQLGIS